MRITANLSIGLLLVLANPAIAEVKKSSKHVITAAEQKNDELNNSYINNYSHNFCAGQRVEFEDCVQKIKTCAARHKNLSSAFDTCLNHIQFKTL